MNKRFIITVSYGDYTTGTGGTDKVILAQQQILNEAQFDVLHFFNYSRFGEVGWWNVLLNGIFNGIYSGNRLKKLLYTYQKEGYRFYGFFIHHLNDIDIDSLEEILDYCSVPIYFYLHDYYTICPKSGLIKEDGTFCGNGFPSEKKCSVCSYYPEARHLIEKTKYFLDKYIERITFIAPSNTAKNIWIKDYPQYSEKVEIIYHQKLVGNYEGNNELILDNEPLRIGFIGYQKSLKGWEQYKQAVARAKASNLNEQFYQFGYGDDKLSYIKQIGVDFKKSMTDMTDALRKNRIQVAVIWSMLPETYAYTYYEALAANCFIITSNLSGNVCDQISIRNNGIIAIDLSTTLCDENNLREMVNSFRKNGHITPNELKENDKFLGMLVKNDWKPKKVRMSFDLSFFFSFLKRLVCYYGISKELK